MRAAYVARLTTETEATEMMHTSRWARAAFVPAALAGGSLGAQPAQFKANVRMVNGDGTASSGMTYFGGAKIRTELTVEGRNVIILADPASRSQVVIMPAEKMYMQMPLGEGPFGGSVTGPSDPANPCSSGGNTDCVKGGR